MQLATRAKKLQTFVPLPATLPRGHVYNPAGNNNNNQRNTVAGHKLTTQEQEQQ